MKKECTDEVLNKKLLKEIQTSIGKEYKPRKYEQKLFELTQKAEKLFEAGKEKEAIETYTAALKIDANYIPALVGKADSLGKLGQYKEAVNICNKALELDPKDDSAYSTKNEILKKSRGQQLYDLRINTPIGDIVDLDYIKEIIAEYGLAFTIAGISPKIFMKSSNGHTYLRPKIFLRLKYISILTPSRGTGILFAKHFIEDVLPIAGYKNIIGLLQANTTEANKVSAKLKSPTQELILYTLIGSAPYNSLRYTSIHKLFFDKIANEFDKIDPSKV